MKKKPTSDFNETIQFRPGENFGKLVAELEKKWGISRNDVVRRLAIMSAFELNPFLYEPIAEAAESLGGIHGFEQASKIVNVALRGGDTNVKPDPGVFADLEKQKQFVRRVLSVVTGRTDYTQFWEDEEKRAEEEKLKQRVQQSRY